MPSLLIAEDSQAERARLLEIARDADLFDVIHEAKDGLEALRLLQTKQVDLALCDLQLPGLTGEKLLPIATAPEAGVTCLMLTSVLDPETRTRLLRLGARDVILKPFHPQELVARLELNLEISTLHDELRRRNRVLSELSITDELTGLANRRALEDFLNKEFRRSTRFGTPFSAVVLDLDYFKRVNDTHGHATGDRVLTAVGDVLRAHTRSHDLAARYGGEEFVLATSSPVEGARIVAERVRALVATTEFRSETGASFVVTVSAGVATRGAATRDPKDLFRAADAALYRAKAAGRNQVWVSSSDAVHHPCAEPDIV